MSSIISIIYQYFLFFSICFTKNINLIYNYGMNRLRELRKNKGITQSELAKMLGITQNNYSYWENGKVKIDNKSIELLADFFNVTTDYLLGVDNINIKRGIKIPVLGSIPAGIPLEAITDIIDYEEIPEEMARSGEYFALKVKGNSMSPEITDGEVAIVKKVDDAESGSICVIMVNGNDATLKRIKKSEQGLTLIPTNTAEFEPMFFTNREIEELPVRIIGRVVETRKTW